MHPSKVIRSKVKKLTDLLNIGVSLADDLQRIGIVTPEDLINKDPMVLFERLCMHDGARHDPCVIDVFMSITDFMNGGEPRVWWDYTAERKKWYPSHSK